jgi:hypothetical protein
MNAKTAKRLRKIALGMCVAAEEKTGKPIAKVGYEQNTKTGNIRVSASTWKGAYKALKRGLKKDALGAAFNPTLKTALQRRRLVQQSAVA